jgi:hypothetical protein
LTAALLLAGVVTAASLVVIASQERTRAAAAPLVLRVLPAALLFLTAPAAMSGYSLVRGFQLVGASGTASQELPLMLVEVGTAMRWGAVGLIVAIVVAAAVTGVLRRAAPASAGLAAVPDAVPRVEFRPGRWFALLSPVALVPAVAVAWLMLDLSSLLHDAAIAFTREPPASFVADMTPSDVAVWASMRLILAVGVGLALSVGLGLLALVTLLPLPAALMSAGVRRYGWIVAGATAAAAVWLLMRFSTLLGRMGDAAGG